MLQQFIIETAICMAVVVVRGLTSVHTSEYNVNSVLLETVLVHFSSHCKQWIILEAMFLAYGDQNLIHRSQLQKTRKSHSSLSSLTAEANFGHLL